MKKYTKPELEVVEIKASTIFTTESDNPIDLPDDSFLDGNN